MKTEKLYLITTADEITWKFDQPVIFLGESCRLYERKHIWKNMEAIVAKPYGLDNSTKEADFSKILVLKQKLFSEFCEILNQHNNTCHSERFWKIFLGHWFERILVLLLNRINTLKQCFKLYKISGTTMLKSNNNLATLDSTHINTASVDDRWNNLLNLQIFNFLKVDFPIKFVQEKDNFRVSPNLGIKPITTNQSFKIKSLNWCLYNFNKISRRFLNDKDAFIMNSYLPLQMEIKLELILKQFPQIWKFQRTKLDLSEIVKIPDKLLRKKLTEKFFYKTDCDFENIVRSLLFKLLPICYLEGFQGVKKIADRQPWPKSPKFIFTSNEYDTNEIFKLWTAFKVESGFKYFIGQHGNNYGTKKNFSQLTETITPDKFITWGHKNLICHTPAFIFKTVGTKKKVYNSKGGIILMQICHPGCYETQDIESQHIKYFDDQKKFVKMLTNDPKKNLTIRLHPAFRIFRWSEKKRWFDFDPSLKLDTCEVNINKLISNNRLVVHSYDSTGMLETLSQNIPTLAFWQNGLDHIESSAIPHYQALIDSGIIHLSAKSIAGKVNNIWNDVDGWWNQNHVQKSRRQFCDIYAKTSQNPLSKLKKILLS